MSEDRFARWYRLIVETAQEGIWLIDGDGKTLFVNPKVCEIVGYELDELIGRDVRELATDADRPGVESRLDQRRVGEWQPLRYEVQIRRKDGEVVDVSFSTSAIVDDGVYVGSLAMITDVTERNRLQRELAASELRFRALAENALDILYRYRLVPDHGWDYLSPAVETITGYTPEEHYADPELAYRRMHPDDLARVRARRPDEIPAGPDTYRFFHRDGRIVWLERRNWVVRDEEGRMVAVEGIARDVTKRVEAEQSFRAVFDNSLAAMAVVDDTQRYVDVNDAACELFGLPREEIVGRTISEVSADAPRAVEVWESFVRGARSGTYELVRPDGSVRTIEFTATANIQPGRHLSVFFDVTGPRQLEEQLRQAQKMEAVGQLAGGVAHDFNNQLGAIRLTAELALSRIDDPARVRAELERIVDITHSGGVLTRQLLAFSRRELVSPRRFDLNDAVSDAEELLRRLIGEHILLERELHPEPLYVDADPVQLEQVLVNLAVNARDAMPGGGRLLLATRAEGDEAAVVVSDTGAGVEEALRERIFEPFFTTKPIGEGTGLGLAIVYAFARQAGGAVRLESEVGEGATFTITLPRVAESAGVVATPPPQVERGTESILLVEDEPDVRHVVEAMLVECGYTVVSVDGPEEALARFSAQDGEFDLLLTDVLMPGMQGTELAQRVHELSPRTAVLFMSGYASDAFGEPPHKAVFLEKPFGSVELTAAVRRALAARH